MGKESLLSKTDGVDNNPSQTSKEEILEQQTNPGLESSLFDESISDAELRGESTSEKNPATEEPSDDTNKKAMGGEKDEKPKDSNDRNGNTSADKAVDDDAKAVNGDAADDNGLEKPSKPPKGFVSLKALHEERRARQGLQDEIQELRDALENQDNGEKEFDPSSTLDGELEILTKEEYDTLNEEDPIAAMQYKLDLREHKDQQRQIKANQQAMVDSIRSGFDKVLEELPEIAEDENTVAEDIEDFASERGIDSKVFLAMANPNTMIVENGRQRPLGTDAADFLLLLHRTMKSQKDMKGTLEEDIRKDVEAELLEKFKKDQSNFKSLEDAPASSEAPEGGLAEFTEDSFRKMSEKDREEALRGL